MIAATEPRMDMMIKLTHRTRFVSRGIVLAAVAVVMAACSSASDTGSTSTPTTTTTQESTPRSPATTTDSDWKSVTDTLGRTGKLGDNNTAYRVALTRNDLQVTSYGVAIKPGLSFGGYAVFVRYDNTTLLMGDLVIAEPEVPQVIDALQSHGIAQTGLHKHLLEQTPPVWWMHIHGMGDPTQLAQGLRAGLDATSIGPPTPPPAQQPPVDIDVAGVQAALGRKGTQDGGLLKFSIPRKDTIVEDGRVLPALSLNLTTGINFQPVGGGRAAINGDFILVDPEIQKVIQTLRRGNIQIVELHNHGLTEQPRLFYMHFWAVDDAVALARALRPALDATNLQPPA
jgi:hypothetical protein